MGKYTNIESGYLKNLIRDLPWDNHEYIDELIQLNEYIKNHPNQWASSIHFRLLKEKYQDEYLVLLKEFSNERYEREVKRMREEKDEELKNGRERQLELDKLRENWLAAGGKE